MSNLSDRIDEEIKNIVPLPDPLTPEQREYLGTLPIDEMAFYARLFVEQNEKANQSNQ